MGAIRLATDEDWDAICRVFSEAGREAWRHILPIETLSTLSASKRWRPGSLGHALVAELAGNVVGFASVRATADRDARPTVGEVDALYTDPAVWGTGHGRALLSAAVESLASNGFTEATLWTEHRNYRPLRFYQNMGWTLDGAERRHSFRGTGLLELRLRRAL